MSTQLGSIASPGGWVCVCALYLCLYLLLQRTTLSGNKAEPEPLTRDDQKDVYLILNASHLVLQMVPSALSSSHRNRDLNCFIPVIRFLLCLPLLLSRLINPHRCRLSPAAWAPASSSPAALLPTRPRSAKRWRFTVCWSWISTPLKVRQPNVHFCLISQSCCFSMERLMVTYCAQLRE